MKLKIKFSEWSAGRPISILSEADSKKIGAHVNDRIVIQSKTGSIISTLDISSKLVKKGQIVVSKEVIKYLALKNGEKVNIEIAKDPRVTEFLTKKLQCKELSKNEIYKIIAAISNNSLTEIEIAFFISAIYQCGMTFNEIVYLTESMFETGNKLNLKNKIIVDKHSIGGVAGNRTTPLIVAICAAQNLVFPKTSSRAITSASGTADTIEAVCKVDFNKKELEKIIRKTNACLAWGGNLGFAPADDKIIKVEKIIQIDPEPNLLASIMAKKLAAGSNHVLIDIPYGDFAKVSYKGAIHLKKQFEKIAKRFKIKIRCVLTPGNQPIGNGVGPVLELHDIFSVLQGNGPYDLREKAIFLAGEIFELTGKSKKGQGKKLAQETLDSGKALEKFKEIILAQSGNLENLSKKLAHAKFHYSYLAKKSGSIKKIDNKKINMVARLAGSPRDTKAGLFIHHHVGNKIKKGEKILTIYSSSKRRLQDAKIFYNEHKIFFI
jgi:AMP phosphorylase